MHTCVKGTMRALKYLQVTGAKTKWVISLQQFKVRNQLSPPKVVLLIINMLLPPITAGNYSSKHYFMKVAVTANLHSLANLSCTFQRQNTKFSKLYLSLLISWSKASGNFWERGFTSALSNFEDPILTPAVHCVAQAGNQWPQNKWKMKKK